MSTNPDIRVNIALGGAQQVSEEMARLQKAMQNYVTTAQQIPKLSPGVDLFTGASLKGAAALKQYEQPMRNIVSLSGQVASGGRSIATAFSGIPSLATTLGFGEIAGVVSGLQEIAALIGTITSAAAGVFALTAGVGVGAAYHIVKERWKLDAQAQQTIEGSVETNYNRLKQIIRERMESGEIRGAVVEDFKREMVGLEKDISDFKKHTSFASDAIANGFARQGVRRLSEMLKKETGVSFETSNEAARIDIRKRFEETREELNLERQLRQQQLNAVLNDEKATEEQRIQAQQFYAARRRGMIHEEAAGQIALIQEQEKQLQAAKLGVKGNKDAEGKIDNQLSLLSGERVLTEKRIATELEIVETDLQSSLHAIREKAARDRENDARKREAEAREEASRRLAEAQQETAAIRQNIQELADAQSSADQRAQLSRTRIDTDFRVSEIERRRMRLEQVDAEIKAADIVIEQYQRVADAALKEYARLKAAGASPEEIAAIAQRVGMANNALRDAERRRDAIRIDRTGLENQANPESVEQQFAAQWHQMRSATEQTARDLASIAMAPFQGMHAGLRDTLDQMMLQGGTFGDFMQGIWRGIGTSMRRALADGVANFVMNHVVMKGVALGWSAFKAALGWQEVNTANAQEAAKTPALATNATLASVGSFGVAAVVGLAAVAAILASVGAFADGGRIYGEGGPREDRVLARVSPGEYVINESAARAVGYDNLDMVNQGKLPVMAAPGATNTTLKSGDVNFALLAGPEMVEQWAESARGRKVIINIMTGAKMELGVPG